MKPRRILLTILLVAAVGLSVFGVLIWRSADFERVPASAAELRFAAVRDSVALQPPILGLDPEGNLIRRPPPPPGAAAPKVRNLEVMAYRGPRRGLVRISVPFWFLRMKMPAVNFVLRDTDVDLGELGITANELARYGPSLVLDQDRENGDRVLVWTR